jgi:hypothetical protein
VIKLNDYYTLLYAHVLNDSQLDVISSLCEKESYRTFARQVQGNYPTYAFDRLSVAVDTATRVGLVFKRTICLILHWYTLQLFPLGTVSMSQSTIPWRRIDGVEVKIHESQASALRGSYSPQITSWYPQRMLVLWQYTGPRHYPTWKHFALQWKKWTRLLQCLNCPMFAVRLWITTSLSLTTRKSSVHLHALYSLRTALRTFTPRRDELMVCGQ